MNTAKKTILTAAGVVALGAGIGLAGLASADPTPSTSPSVSASPTAGSTTDPGPRAGYGRGGHRMRGGADATELATRLGLDEATVRTALREVLEATRPMAKPTPGTTRPDRAVQDAALAKALAPKLGVDEAKIKTALDEIRATRQADRAAELKTHLDTAVKDGTLTQAEADAVQKAVEQGVIGGGGR